MNHTSPIICKYLFSKENRYSNKRTRHDIKKNLIYKKKLHDIFKILKGTTKELHNLVDEMNRIHPTLTINHTAPENEADCDKCDCETKTSIPFLDTLFSIENGKIDRNG